MNYIHPTAVISPDAKIGSGNYIGAFTVIHAHVTIGDNNHIGEHCIIGDIGESTKYFDKNPKGVIIGDHNRFTKQVTIDCGTEQDTVIGNNTLILKNGHVGHDAIVEDYSEIRCNALVGGHAVLKDHVILCIGVVIQPRITVPKWAYIGACSNVTRKTLLNECWVHYGNPCKPIRERD